MPKVGGRADGKRVSALVQEALRADAAPDRALQRRRRRARRHRRRVLRALEGHVDCDARSCAATSSRSTATPRPSPRAAPVVRELAELIEQGHEIGAGHDRRGHRRARPARVAGARSSRTSSGATARARSRRRRSTRSATSTRSAATRSRSASARPAPARRSSPSRWPPRRSRAARSTGSSSRARPSRPGERLGFLPGDLMAKIDPYLRPLFDALHDMIDPEKVSGYLERGVIEVAPLAFMRGRTLNDSFVILDEAQNTTPEQMKMFLTRLGFDSKMVITGDITQIDLPREQQSGLVVVGDILDDGRGHRVRALRRRGRRAPPARPAHRRGLRRARRARGARAAARRAGPPPRLESSPCSRSRSSARSAARSAADRRDRAARRARAGVGGRRRRPRGGRVRRRRSGSRSSTREHRGKPRADRRALVPDRRRRRARPAARAARVDLPVEKDLSRWICPSGAPPACDRPLTGPLGGCWLSPWPRSAPAGRASAAARPGPSARSPGRPRSGSPRVPATRFSIAHTKCGRSMRFIVEQ